MSSARKPSDDAAASGLSRPARLVIVGNPTSAGSNAIFDELVTRLRSPACEITRYTSQAAFREAADALRDADVFVAVSGFPCSRALMASAPKLRAVVCPVTGTNGYEISAATELGICVANGHTPENYESMAEATIMLMLALCYDLRSTEERLRRGGAREAVTRATMLRGKKLGLIGFGMIARAVAERLRGWGVTIQAYAPRDGVRPFPADVKRVSLDELIATSDVISVHAALNDESHRLLNRERLAATKHGAILINTARGGLIDETALAELARLGHFGGIALDVFEKELQPDHPLRGLPNVILTPHMVGHARELHESQIRAAYENVTKVLRGELPPHLCNPAVATSWFARWGGQSLLPPAKG